MWGIGPWVGVARGNGPITGGYFRATLPMFDSWTLGKFPLCLSFLTSTLDDDNSLLQRIAKGILS